MGIIMKGYAYTYKSQAFASENEANSLCNYLLDIAQVSVHWTREGYIVTCGLGDEDELMMLEYQENKWERENK